MYCLAQQSNSAESDSESSSELDVKKPEIPALFYDPGYAQLGHSTLSTSNCGNPSLRLFGFSAVVPDGFGIGYIIKVRLFLIVDPSLCYKIPRLTSPSPRPDPVSLARVESSAFFSSHAN
jgi:hypothetical protein